MRRRSSILPGNAAPAGGRDDGSARAPERLRLSPDPARGTLSLPVDRLPVSRIRFGRRH